MPSLGKVIMIVGNVLIGLYLHEGVLLKYLDLSNRMTLFFTFNLQIRNKKMFFHIKQF